MDVQSISKWEDYSRAKDEMFIHTDIPEAPWFTVESEDKKRSRINVISHILSSVPYEHIDPEPVTIPERPKAITYLRPPRDEFRYVPDHAASLVKPGPDLQDRRFSRWPFGPVTARARRGCASPGSPRRRGSTASSSVVSRRSAEHAAARRRTRR